MGKIFFLPKFTEFYVKTGPTPYRYAKLITHEIMSNPVVVVLFVVVEPDFSEPDRVPPEDVDAGPPLVGRPLPEDVTHMGTGNDL